MSAPRVGLGFDVHPLARERPLLLGGVRFDGEAGLAGHSDGDVVCHALGEAILGGAALGDLGEHFPDEDAATEGIAGSDLLARCVALAAERGWRLDSCDLTVIAERPMLAPRREEMRTSLVALLGIEKDGVSVKATRPEGLGLTGDGAACIAIAVLSTRR